MTNKIVSALDDGLKDVAKSAEDGGEAFAKHVEETGTKLEGDAKAHAATDLESKDGLTKAGEKKADPEPEAKASTAEKDAADKAAADKAAAEAKAAAENKAKVDVLRTQGHAPQRHLDPSDDRLKQRLGTPKTEEVTAADGTKSTQIKMKNGFVATKDMVDPGHTDADLAKLSGKAKYKDAYTGKPHYCASYSTAYGDSESLAKADAAGRAAIPAGATGRQVISVDAKTTLGDDGVSNLRGFYIDPKTPVTGGTINYKPVDFTGGKLTTIYDPDGKGGWNLVTSYPNPVDGVNT